VRWCVTFLAKYFTAHTETTFVCFVWKQLLDRFVVTVWHVWVAGTVVIE